jgi:ATP-dependent exoDNAse (exonuclease V) beta subunit
MSKLKIYKASAGSGKTYTLALEYIRELLTAPSAENYPRSTKAPSQCRVKEGVYLSSLLC